METYIPSLETAVETVISIEQTFLQAWLCYRPDFYDFAVTTFKFQNEKKSQLHDLVLKVLPWGRKWGILQNNSLNKHEGQIPHNSYSMRK